MVKIVFGGARQSIGEQCAERKNFRCYTSLVLRMRFYSTNLFRTDYALYKSVSVYYSNVTLLLQHSAIIVITWGHGVSDC